MHDAKIVTFPCGHSICGACIEAKVFQLTFTTSSSEFEQVRDCCGELMDYKVLKTCISKKIRQKYKDRGWGRREAKIQGLPVELEGNTNEEREKNRLHARLRPTLEVAMKRIEDLEKEMEQLKDENDKMERECKRLRSWPGACFRGNDDRKETDNSWVVFSNEGDQDVTPEEDDGGW
ncbi:hypothetical protein B0T16DRAFT_457406 [Cercophora newfieldiana]|uniref:Uncharacterized protein n=1 Tax=Cercophora newfieldiana TaxID=92897 RepID=A0AA40CPZ8_9PEZI|nr:hypothetical protein B0T16DRAFT_457406 [Cercophora newfieldiana]